MFTLAFSILALFAAVPLYEGFRRNWRLFRLLDGFIFVAIGGLVVALILPSVIGTAGWTALALFAGGIWLPSVSERLFHQSVSRMHLAAILIGVLGFALHVIADGAALSSGHGHDSDHALALGIVLHRLPIGLAIWWFVRPTYGAGLATGLLACIGIGTVVGYTSAPTALAMLSSEGMALFQAFVAGTLLHVVLHGIDTEHASKKPTRNTWEGAGNLLGVALMAYVLIEHPVASSDSLDSFIKSLSALTLESAPALVIAYVAASIFATLVPQSYFLWMSKGSAIQQSLRGVAVGLPVPVCSCGVVPLYHALIRKGVPPAAAMAFLVATPELGIDAILLSLPLLGGTMTLVRVAAAVVVALLIGILVGRLVRSNEADLDGDAEDGRRSGNPLADTRASAAEIVDHTAPWIVVGILVAAALNPFLQNGGFDWLPAGLEVPFFALLGLPMYVCASGATPLVAIFLLGGVSPGAALAFLLTGPATNITTFGVLQKLHGRRVAAMFGATTFALTVTLGYLTNLALPNFEPMFVTDEHQDWHWLNVASVLVLLLFLLDSILRRGARAFMGELYPGGHEVHDHVHAH